MTQLENERSQRFNLQLIAECLASRKEDYKMAQRKSYNCCLIALAQQTDKLDHSVPVCPTE
jgi:hypothetical protein